MASADRNVENCESEVDDEERKKTQKQKGMQ